METLALLNFLTEKYKEVESNTERNEISTLYWTVLDYTLNGYTSVPIDKADTLITPILN